MNCDALINSNPNLSLISETLLDELERAVDPAKHWLKTERCDTNLQSFTQATSPLTKRLQLKLNFERMSLIQTVYMSCIDTEMDADCDRLGFRRQQLTQPRNQGELGHESAIGLGDSPVDTYRPPLIVRFTHMPPMIEDAILATCSEKSAISLEMFNAISKTAICNLLVLKT